MQTRSTPDDPVRLAPLHRAPIAEVVLPAVTETLGLLRDADVLGHRGDGVDRPESPAVHATSGSSAMPGSQSDGAYLAPSAPPGAGTDATAAPIRDEETDLLDALRPLLRVIEELLGVSPPSVRPTERWRLTDREADVLGYLADGLTAEAIGSACGISVRTVRKHLENAYVKLGAHDKVTAVLRFRGADHSEPLP